MTSEHTTAPGPDPTALDEASALGRNKHILLAALKQGGARSATVTYAGSGDFRRCRRRDDRGTGPKRIRQLGRDHRLHGSKRPPGPWQTATVEQQVTIEQALSDSAEQALELLPGGWEINDGASGNVIFDCQVDVVSVEHTTYYTESDCEETAL